MVFVEGPRFSEAKRVAQSSPYRHLLKPKAGGLAVALNAMGTRFRSMLDVTIAYPEGIPRFWDLARSEKHTSELQSLMRISYAVFCLKKQRNQKNIIPHHRPSHCIL